MALRILRAGIPLGIPFGGMGIRMLQLLGVYCTRARIFQGVSAAKAYNHSIWLTDVLELPACHSTSSTKII